MAMYSSECKLRARSKCPYILKSDHRELVNSQEKLMQRVKGVWRCPPQVGTDNELDKNSSIFFIVGSGHEIHNIM